MPAPLPFLVLGSEEPSRETIWKIARGLLGCGQGLVPSVREWRYLASRNRFAGLQPRDHPRFQTVPRRGVLGGSRPVFYDEAWCQ
jgi:hypothetical protein